MEEKDEKFSKERRRAPRVSGAIVEYSIEGQASSDKKAFIKDICIYGICIYVPETIKNKTILCLDIYLFGNENPIKTKGKVVWQKPGNYLGYYNVGVEFVDMSEEYQKILSEHIVTNYREIRKVRKKDLNEG